jgi:hypothetical protein
LKRLPLAPRPIKGELLSSWMARVSAVNGLTMSELIEYADGTPNRAKIMQVDCDTSRSLIAGLAQACCISQDSLDDKPKPNSKSTHLITTGNLLFPEISMRNS